MACQNEEAAFTSNYEEGAGNDNVEFMKQEQHFKDKDGFKQA